MAQLQWKRLIGQEHIKEVLTSAFSRDTLGHAYLLCGDTGVGTFTAALELTMALHCAAEGARPCYTCSQCHRVLNFSHPDFHVVMPLSLQREHKGSDGKITDAGWEELSLRVRERVEDPYRVQEFSSRPAIPVEWIREITHTIRRGGIEEGKNIVIIDGIDMMQKESANAMLKTLEEPPEGTLLFLCTERPHAVLPTILSRCQILRFAALKPALIRSQLIGTLSIDDNDPRLDEVIHCGSLGKARLLLDHVDSEDRGIIAGFWRDIVTGDWLPLFERIDQLVSIGDYGRYENFFIQLMYGIRNAFLTNMEGTENYIMGDRSLASEFEGITSPQMAEALVQCCETAVGRLRSHVNSGLVLTNFALAVMECYHGKKQ